MIRWIQRNNMPDSSKSSKALGLTSRPSSPLVSVVVPARNAEKTIENCLRTLGRVDYPKDRIEVIVVDGLSTDRTRAIAENHGAKVVTNPGVWVVSARNLGVHTARGEVIAFCDADCTPDVGWLKNCLKYFQDPYVAGVGGPNLVPPDEAPFGKAIGLLFDYAFTFRAGAPTRICGKVIEYRAHGCNAIYRASVLRRVMPMDEDMLCGEDVVMNNRIQQLGYKLLYVPDVIMWHFRGTTPTRWWSQMYRYGVGKAIIFQKAREALTLTQLLLGLTIPLTLAAVALLIMWSPYLLGTFALWATLVFALLTSSFAYIRTRSVRVALNMPLATMIMLLAWSTGFLYKVLAGTKRPREDAHQ